MIFWAKNGNSSHSGAKTSTRSFPISQSSVTAPTASVSSITSSEHSAQWYQRCFEVATITKDIFYASLNWINIKYYISQKIKCNFVKCLNPMCSAVVYTGCIWYKKVPVVLRNLMIHRGLLLIRFISHFCFLWNSYH